MRQFWTYTLLRLGLVAAAAGLLWLVGLRGPVLIVSAFLVSGVISFVVLARQRGALARTVDSRARRIRERMAEAEAAEDAADEAKRSSGAPSTDD
jgi:membrane protein implicated in regulation of membrane protease activity